MSTHLDESALEALAHGRSDLLSAEQNAHADICADCVAALREARALSFTTRAALDRAAPEAIDLDALVAGAVASVPSVARVPRASRRSLLFGGLCAAPLALLLGLASILEGFGAGAVFDALNDAWTVGFTLTRLAVVHVTPEMGGTVAAAGAVVIALLSLVMRALVGGATLARPAVEVVR